MMKIKEILLYAISAILLFSFGFVLSQLEPCFRQKIFKIMTAAEFENDKNEKRWNELYLNKDGNVSYKDMVIVRDNTKEPINRNTALYTNEMIMTFRAEGTRPEEWGCDQSDILKNGAMGCYLDIPEENN